MSDIKTVELNTLELDVNRNPCEVYKTGKNTKAQKFRLCITELSPPARTAYLKHISPEKRLPEKIISLQKQSIQKSLSANNTPLEKSTEKIFSPRTLSLQRSFSLDGLSEEKPVSPKPSLSNEELSPQDNSVEALISQRIKVIKSFLHSKEFSQQSHEKIISLPETTNDQKSNEVKPASSKRLLRISPKNLLPDKPVSPLENNKEKFKSTVTEHTNGEVLPNRHITAIKVKIKRKSIPPKTVSLEKVESSSTESSFSAEKLVSLWQSGEEKTFSPEKGFSPDQRKLVPESSVTLKVLPPEKSGVIYKYRTVIMDNTPYQSFMRVKRERPKSSIPKPWVQKTRKRPLTALR